MVRSRVARFTVVLACSTVTAAAVADDGAGRATPASSNAADDAASSARALFELGVDSVRREAWAEGAAHFERSASFVPRQSTLYNLALCRHHLNEDVAALEVIDRLLSSADAPDAGTRAHAEKLRERALERIVVLDVTVDPQEASIVVDGVLLPRVAAPVRRIYLAPGGHDVGASAPGRAPARFRVEGRAGQSFARSVVLAVAPPVGAPPPPEKALPKVVPEPATGVAPHWILLGAGGLLLAGAAVTGAIAWKADGDFVDACPSNHRCDPSLVPLQERAKTFGLASDVLLGLGLATGGVGAVLLWKTESSASNERAIGVSVHGAL